MNSFLHFLDEQKPKLIRYLRDDIEKAIGHNPLPVGKKALEKVKESVVQGKCLRGGLVLLSAHIHGVALTEEVYHTAASMEILQAGLLIHDDIIDNDMKRRGMDSMYSQYIQEGTQAGSGDPVLYGQSMGICIGDMTFFLVTELLAKQVKTPEIFQCIVAYLSQEVQFIAPAQMMDASFSQTSYEPTIEEIRIVYLYKTAYYSFSLPLIIGSVFQSKDTRSLLHRLGEHLGMIFQLKDDELGLYAGEELIGKPIGSDIRENKKTLYRKFLFDKASKKEVMKLSTIFGNKSISFDEISYVRNLMRSYEIDKKIRSIIHTEQRHVQDILSDLSEFGIDTTTLSDLSDYNLTRAR